ncbi:MAG: hypothetical protein KAS38_12030 [Anaerolineales bacterium]|nr:hypothetical protein [Anaerolineales bacterium]
MLVIIGSIVGPQIYQEPDNAVRLNLIANDQTGWFISNLSFALGAVATAIGFLLISIHLRGSVPLWLPYLAATVFILGSVFWVIFLYVRTTDPAAYIESDSLMITLIYAFFWLTEAGLLLYGFVFIRASYPNWLGYLSIVFVGLLGAAALFFGSQFFDFLPPQIFNLLTLVIGIVVLRHRS